jgi:hypothetical protein
MTILKTLLAAASLAAGAAPAFAEAPNMGPGVRVQNAAARVVVIAEPRSDYTISISQGRAGLKPLEIRKDGGVTVVDGGLGNVHWSWGPKVFGLSGGWNGLNCKGSNNNQRVVIPGKGEVALADLPVVTIHAPLNAHLGSSGAVYGEVNVTDALTLSNAGCGDWRIADVHGPLHLSMSGSGDVRGAATGDAYIAISGSSDVILGAVNGRLETHTSGSGDIHTASARGGISTKIAGSGDVTVDGGETPNVGVSIAGSGDFRFRGTAGAVNASIAGSGDVDIAHATGPVSKHVAGSGDVNIGR